MCHVQYMSNHFYKLGISVRCGNGFSFTRRFGAIDFSLSAHAMREKSIISGFVPFAPRHNDEAERSHRKGNVSFSVTQFPKNGIGLQTRISLSVQIPQAQFQAGGGRQIHPIP